MPFFKKINFPIIYRLLGILLIMNSLFMFVCVPVSYFYGERAYQGLFYAAAITFITGALAFYINKNASKNIGKREGYLIVSLGWFVMSFFGTLPYLCSIPFIAEQVQSVNHLNLTNAIFEVTSGYSTTGASILNNIEDMPKGLLLWRSFTHWIGGMGIIVLTIAILPLLGIGGMQLFVAEAPGITPDKLHPRITDTAKRLWGIYVLLTAIEVVLLRVTGMNWYDAFNHSFATISSGGFSTKNASIAYWNNKPLVQYVIILFMFFAGTNFVLIYYMFKGKFKKIWENLEFRYYVAIIGVLTLLATFFVKYYADPTLSSVYHPGILTQLNEVSFKWEPSFRHSLFSILSVITTTGFVSADFTQWTPFLTAFFFALMFIGGSAGSTAGGVKIVRHIVLIKNSLSEFKRLVHPNAIVPVRYGDQVLNKKIVFHVMAFFITYISIFIFSTTVLSLIDTTQESISEEFFSSMGVAATTLGNIGPALGRYSPVDNYSSMSDAAKWFCSFLMILGRLELFTVLLLFTPYFWKK